METQKILNFITDLNSFIEQNEKEVQTKDIRVSQKFISTIEALMNIDDTFTLNHMDLKKHIVYNEDGSFYLSDLLKSAIFVA